MHPYHAVVRCEALTRNAAQLHVMPPRGWCNFNEVAMVSRAAALNYLFYTSIYNKVYAREIVRRVNGKCCRRVTPLKSSRPEIHVYISTGLCIVVVCISRQSVAAKRAAWCAPNDSFGADACRVTL